MEGSLPVDFHTADSPVGDSRLVADSQAVNTHLAADNRLVVDTQEVDTLPAADTRLADSLAGDNHLAADSLTRSSVHKPAFAARQRCRPAW